MPKVSLLIPTYNVEAYLEECLESVVRQTLKDIEIICINDGSTDSSLSILKRYAEKDSRIVLIDKANSGYGASMNIGLEKATGEYIGIVEPDDFVPLNMYEDLYEIAHTNDLDFVKADFYRFKRAANGDMELKYFHLSKDESNYNKVFNPSESPETLRFVMNTWSGIYKREFIEKHHIRHNETPGASFQDNGFFFQTFAFAKSAMIVNKPYYMNRRDNPGSSVHDPNKVYCINVEYDFIRSIIEKDPEVWERFKYMYWVKKYTNYNGTITRIGPEHVHDYVIRFAKEFNDAKAAGELSEEIFKPKEWARLTKIMEDPEKFYKELTEEPKKPAKASSSGIKKTAVWKLARKVKRKLFN